MTIRITVMEFPTFNIKYWPFLVKRDVGPIFCINIVHCVQMKAEKLILAHQKKFKTDFSTWQLLGLERTLLSGLPHIFAI